jgi:pilus assembly protein CpaD
MTITRTLLLSSLALLAACAPRSTGLRDNAEAETIHKASVAFQQSVHPLTVTGDALSTEETAALDAFVSTMGLSYADRITLQLGDSVKAESWRKILNSALGRHGLSVSAVQAGPGFGTTRAQLVIDRATMQLPDCGKHDQPFIMNWKNEKMHNFGCASRNNLASMIANPADIVGGTALTLQPASATAKPVNAWDSHDLTGVTGGKQGWTAQGPGSKPESGTKLTESKTNTKE